MHRNQGIIGASGAGIRKLSLLEHTFSLYLFLLSYSRGDFLTLGNVAANSSLHQQERKEFFSHQLQQLLSYDLLNQ